MYDGFFTHLTEVVRFSAARNSEPQRWYGPVPKDLPSEVVAFLLSLSDGSIGGAGAAWRSAFDARWLALDTIGP